MNDFLLLLSDANTRWVLAATMLLGVSSGVLGSFALLRKHSLIGDAMAHAALPGICLAYMLTGIKSIGFFMIGAACTGLLAAFLIQYISSKSRIKEDTSLGLVLSVFFGIGIVLLTRIAHSPGGNKSGLDHFLFGKAASLVGSDVTVMTWVSVALIVITFLLFKEFKVLCFDPQFGRGLGMPMNVLSFLLMTLIVGAVVIGLQAVGVVLMAAMLITPAITARYWTDRLELMVVFAGVFGAVSGVVGTLFSSLANNMPTGPLIVLAATTMFLISLIFSPKRGLLMKSVNLMKTRKIVGRENMIGVLYELQEMQMKKGYRFPLKGHTVEDIIVRRPQPHKVVIKWLKTLENDGLVVGNPIHNGKEVLWSLTEKGIEVGYRLTLNKRMREIYLMYESKFQGYRVELNKSVLDQSFPRDIVQQLKDLVNEHQLHPLLVKKQHPGGELSV